MPASREIIWLKISAPFYHFTKHLTCTIRMKASIRCYHYEGFNTSLPLFLQVKGGYVSPYSCQALGLKKRSNSQTSLSSTGSTEFDSPVRKSASKSGSLSGSKASLLSRSSSKGSVTKGPGTFGWFSA